MRTRMASFGRRGRLRLIRAAAPPGRPRRPQPYGTHGCEPGGERSVRPARTLPSLQGGPPEPQRADVRRNPLAADRLGRDGPGLPPPQLQNRGERVSVLTDLYNTQSSVGQIFRNILRTRVILNEQNQWERTRNRRDDILQGRRQTRLTTFENGAERVVHL